MNKAVFAILIAAFSGCASAAWERIASGDGQDIYVDRSTIRRSGTKVKMWHMFDRWEPKVVRDTVVDLSSKGYVEYDCKNEQSRLLYHSEHSGQMGGGTTVFDGNIPTPTWSPIPPESIVEGFWKIACGK